MTVLFVAVAALGYAFAEPIERVSAVFLEHFGRAGLFAAVFIMDAIPFTTHEPVLFLAYTGGVTFWQVFGLAGTASVLSGILGWTMGRVLARWRWLGDLFERSQVGPFLRRYGVVAIAAAALTPFPYAITTWGAGMVGVRIEHLMIGALFRYPKVLFYLTIMALGWEATTP
ncbi:MAG: hypothetical protein JRI25_25115 [Deltaproteobacteria bacterium]|nr:hypothetical protein [Deltaproteobacteria bacterium]MBW2257861.1 hypothetical protein [Deltaproteobacteria bacterium]